LRAKASPTVFAIQQSCHSVFAQKRQTLSQNYQIAVLRHIAYT